MDRRWLQNLLATSSVTALLIGGAQPAAAQCVAVTGAYTNTSVVVCVTVAGQAFSGNISNAGTITPGNPTGISITGSAIQGAIIDTGTIIATGPGIAIDASSRITPTGTAVVVGGIGSTFTGGISNAGVISTSGGVANGVAVTGVSNFSGGIVNATGGSITATLAGISVGGSTFSGGITNAGSITAGAIGIQVNNLGSFVSGNIANSGAISVVSAVTGAGIAVAGVSLFSGSIINSTSGTISVTAGSAAVPVLNAGIVVWNDQTFTGDIVNAGSITASSQAQFGIAVAGVSTFTGNIVNAGTGLISAPVGIAVGSPSSVFQVSNFTGGISNAGTISSSRAGILLNGVSTFAGQIVNSVTGTITAGLTGIGVIGGSTFSGGITNAGTILTASPSGIGIFVSGVSSFSGDITNSGTISALFGSAQPGIWIDNVSAFSGNIVNATGGTIAARTGILVGCSCGVSTFTGSIVNAGTITANRFGVGVVNVGTFTGSIVNNATGVISGQTGILVGGTRFARPVSAFTGDIINSGAIFASRGIVVAVSTFSGQIVNSGTGLIQAQTGIVVGSTKFSRAASNFTGGITNAGSIFGSSAGIVVAGVSTFSGQIVNSGTGSITAGFTGIGVIGGSIFSGGITNAGAIQTTGTSGVGIFVSGVSAFAGDITNSGTISATGAAPVPGVNQPGIWIDNVSAFSGNIVNAGGGTISEQTGILVGCSCGVSTFTGNIVNNGIITASLYGVSVVNVGTFIGSVVNNSTGTISARFGILVGSTTLSRPVSTFTGGITNAGTVSAGFAGIAVGGVSRQGALSSFGGGITNTGSIQLTGNGGSPSHGSPGGIVVGSLSTFTGGIANTGTISATTPGPGASFGTAGILVGGVNFRTSAGSRNVGTFAGGITNTGQIDTIRGIILDGVSAASGGIANSGQILAAAGGASGTGIGVLSVSTFAGGIANSGTIAVANASLGRPVGILVAGTATFAGGITNGGIITAGYSGIGVLGVAAFSGGITNGGTITGSGVSAAGFVISGVSTFAGGIVNRGTISVRSDGMIVNTISTFTGDITNSGTILAGKTGIAIGDSVASTSGISTFAGGIANSGTISGGSIGILIQNTPAVSIFNSGTIIGAGGTAIQFGAATNTLTLVPGFQIVGNVIGAGSDTLQLAGSGTGAFNVSLVGPSTQYRGFVTFQKFGSSIFDLSGMPMQTVNWDVTGGFLNFASASVFTPGSITLNGGGLQWAPGNTADISALLRPIGSAGGTFDIEGNNVTLASAISGPGAITKLGTGALTLSGANSYAGGTNLDVGTLVAGNNSAFGTGTLAMAAGTTLSFAGGNFTIANKIQMLSGDPDFTPPAGTTQTLSGAIADGTSPGTFNMQGPGTLVLAGASSYTGPTGVNGGTLRAGANNAFAPASPFTVAAGATLDLNNFAETIVSVVGAGNVMIGGGALTLTNATGQFGGMLSGTGSLTLAAGTETLTGNSAAFTGATFIAGGAGLVVGPASTPGAVLGSSVTLRSGGALSGYGTVLGSVGNGGTVTPGTLGGSIGTLTVGGNYSQSAGGALVVQLTPAAASKLAVGGAASLNGTLTAVAAVKTGFLPNSRYPILTAGGGVSGTFSQFIDGLGLPALSVVYLPNEVDLGVAGFTGQTRNQIAVANALNLAGPGATGDLASVLEAAILLPQAQIERLLTSLGGQIYGNLAEVSLQNRRLFLGTMDERMRLGGGEAAGAAQLGGLVPGGWGGGGNAPQMAALGNALSDRDEVAQAAATPGAAPAAPTSYWARGFGQFGDIGSNGGALGIDYSTGGGAMGADLVKTRDSLVGLALGGGQSSVSASGDPESGRVSFVQLGAYGAQAFDYGLVADGALVYAHDSYRVSRVLVGLGRAASSSHGGDDAAFDVGLSRSFAVANLQLTPRAGLSYFHIGQSSFAETGANSLDLAVSPVALDALRSKLGGTLSLPAALGDTVLQTELHAAWTHDFLDDRGAFAASFAGAPGISFTQIGAATGRNALELGAAVNFAIPQTAVPGHLAGFVQYDASIAVHQTNNAVAAGLRLTW